MRTVKVCWVTLATCIVLLAVVITTIKYALPFADDYKSNIESYVQQNFGATITIGEIGASWQTSGPVVTLYDLALEPSVQAPLDISIAETQLKVNFWQSLLQQRFVSESFVLDGVKSKINSEVFYQIRPNSGGSQLLDNLSHLFLTQLHAFKLINSDVQVKHKNGKTQRYHLESLNWINSENTHQASGNLYVDGFSNNSISFIANLYGNKRENIFGQVYFEASQMDVSPWLVRFMDEHVELSSTQANFKAWGEIKNGLVNDILLDVYDTGLNWSLGKQNKYLGIKNTRLHWWKSDAAWIAFANDIKLHTQDQSFEEFYLTLFADVDHTLLNVGDARIDTLSQLFSLFSATKKLDFLTRGSISGKVDNLQVQWDAHDAVAAKFDLEQVNVLPHLEANQAYLGMTDLDVKGYWYDQQAWLELSGNDGQLHTRDTFSDTINYDRLYLSGYYNAQNEVTSVTFPKFELRNEEIDIALSAQYVIGEQDILSLYAEVKGPQQGAIHQYLPKYLIDEETYDYLMDGIQQGRGEFTQVLIYGDPSEVLDSSKAQLQVKADIRDGIFKFDPEWPQVEELDAQLWVRSDTMTIVGESGQFYGIKIENDLTVDIPLVEQKPNLLVLFSPEQIEFSRFHKLVEDSPLNEVLGDVFEFVKLDGEATATVSISIPKYEGLDVVAQGTVVTSAASLDLPDLALSFTDLDTLVNFNNENIDISTTSGKLYGLPVSFTVTGDQVGEDYRLDASLLANWSADEVNKHYPSQLKHYFEGLFNTELMVKVNLQEQDYQYFVDGKTSLSLAGYEVTPELNKAVGESGYIDISAIGDETGSQIEVNFDDTAYFSGYVDHESASFKQANLAIGTDETALPEQGFDIKLGLDKVSFEPTLNFVIDIIDTVQSNASSSQTEATDKSPLLPVPHHVYGNIQHLDILEQQWQSVSLDGKPELDAWLFSIGAQQTLTEVWVYDDLAQKGIDIKSTFLQIKVEDTEQEDKSPSTEFTNSAKLISDLPPIQFFCESCSYNGLPLGKVELNTYSQGKDLFIDKASMQYKRNRINLKGTWFGDEGPGKTQITGKVYSRYFGDWLKEYGLDTGVKDSHADMELDLAWESAPFLFGYDSLNGSAKFKLGEGYLSEVSDKGARIFSLFSFDSLYRKLKFDFNDVFEKGLFYNDIKGDILVKDGVAYSDNIVMDGVAGNMEMAGFTDLNSNTLDYNVTFKPKWTSSLGVITWIAASNPLAVIGAIAIDKIIEEAEVVAEVRMKVSGNLSEPKVEEVKRFKKKVQMPSKEEIEKYKQSHAAPAHVKVDNNQ